jgi:hypothetical protein
VKIQCPTRDEEKKMPMQTQEQTTLNVKLVHFTKQNSPDEPVQVAFAVTDDQGRKRSSPVRFPTAMTFFTSFRRTAG